MYIYIYIYTHIHIYVYMDINAYIYINRCVTPDNSTKIDLRRRACLGAVAAPWPMNATLKGSKRRSGHCHRFDTVFYTGSRSVLSQRLLR